MIGAKPGGHVLAIGASNAALVAELALVTGLNGRTLVVDRAPGTRDLVKAAAARAGALVDFEDAPATMLPLDAGTFDVVVIQQALAAAADRSQVIAEAARVLRVGGRVVIIEGATRAGILGVLARSAAPKADAKSLLETMTAAGLKAVRVLSESDGVLYLEGTKGRA
jgi:ubiquinone/menaquinone biosynthesis C-methylase UbiE